MVSLTELIIKYHAKIMNGDNEGLYGEISPSLELEPDNFIEAQRMLLVLKPEDITEINIGLVVAYLENSRDLESSYAKIRKFLGQVADSPYLPEETRISIGTIIR